MKVFNGAEIYPGYPGQDAGPVYWKLLRHVETYRNTKPIRAQTPGSTQTSKQKTSGIQWTKIFPTQIQWCMKDQCSEAAAANFLDNVPSGYVKS